jgi:ABC-type branched-subunit amino acid transport system ATPase component
MPSNLEIDIDRNGEDRPPVIVLLRAVDLAVGYGPISVVHDVNLHVSAGEVIALLGPNGAGKTTLLLGLAGELSPSRGRVEWLGRSVRSRMHVRCKEGLGFVPGERSVIFGISVLDNLRLGQGDIDLALDLFPELRPLLRRQGGLLSGGEQQILSLARALSRAPKLLLIDELSLGLAPMIVARLLEAVRSAAEAGVGILLVEQQVQSALLISDRAYVMGRGNVVMSGASHELLGRLEDIEGAYLEGVARDSPPGQLGFAAE